MLGTGLIGASIGLALRRPSRTSRAEVTGWDPDRRALRIALVNGCIDIAAASLEGAVHDADIVVLASPLDAAAASVARVIREARDGALVIDVTPVKRRIVAAAKRALRDRSSVAYVSGHPIAGKESAGPHNADADLFARRPFALVAPQQPGARRAIARAAAFARRLGAVPIEMTAVDHDRNIAAVSALPQLAAVALAAAVDIALRRRKPAFVGPGYTDATRLAASPFHIWRPALAGNQGPVRAAVRALERALKRVRKALDDDDFAALAAFFRRAQVARRRSVAT